MYICKPFTLSGEANTEYHRDKYNCSFPAMIDDWRMEFHQGSGGQTALDFPFGFVQVGTTLPFFLFLNLYEGKINIGKFSLHVYINCTTVND